MPQSKWILRQHIWPNRTWYLKLFFSLAAPHDEILYPYFHHEIVGSAFHMENTANNNCSKSTTYVNANSCHTKHSQNNDDKVSQKISIFTPHKKKPGAYFFMVVLIVGSYIINSHKFVILCHLLSHTFRNYAKTVVGSTSA